MEVVWERNNAAQSLMNKVQGKLKMCNGDLLRWNSLRASDGEKEILRLTERLKK